jgi:hypothetical protein
VVLAGKAAFGYAGVFLSSQFSAFSFKLLVFRKKTSGFEVALAHSAQCLIFANLFREHGI